MVSPPHTSTSTSWFSHPSLSIDTAIDIMAFNRAGLLAAPSALCVSNLPCFQFLLKHLFFLSEEQESRFLAHCPSPVQESLAFIRC